MAYNADDPKQVAKAKKEAEFNEALKLDEIRHWMSTPVGRKLFYDFFVWTKIWKPIFVEGDPHSTSWREGNRNAGLYWLVDIQTASAELYAQMMNEAKSNDA